MGIEYSKLSNKISGLLGALDDLARSGKADEEQIACDELPPLNVYLEEQQDNLFQFDLLSEQKQSTIARNLMEYVDCLSKKSANSLDMPQEPGMALVTGGEFVYRPNGPVAIEAGSFSSSWIVKTSGVVARTDGIEIPFGLVKVENANAYVRGTVRHTKFDIVLESDSPMKVDENGTTHVAGQVIIKTPFGSFIAESSGSFKIAVAKYNESPLLIVKERPIQVRSIEKSENNFRINKGGVSLYDTHHYAFLKGSEFELGETLNGIAGEDITKTASRFQTEADTGLSFGEWDPAHIRPDDKKVYSPNRNFVELLASNRIKITADRSLTAFFLNPTNDSFFVSGDGVITLRQIIVHDVKPNNGEISPKIDWLGLVGDGAAPSAQADFGFSEVVFNEQTIETSPLQKMFFGISCLSKEAPQTEDKKMEETSIFRWRDADIKDPSWGYFLEIEGAIHVKGLWKDSFHPVGFGGAQIIFARGAGYTGGGELAEGSLSIFEPKNEGSHFWIPGYRSDLQNDERNFDLTDYHQGIPIETLIPAQDKQATIAHGKRPQTIFEFLLNDAVCKEEYDRASAIAKLSQNESLIKQLAKIYQEASSAGWTWESNKPPRLNNPDRVLSMSRHFVDLAIYYHQHFGKTVIDDSDYNLLLVLMKSPRTYDGWDNGGILLFPDGDEMSQVLTDMGVPQSRKAVLLGKMGFYDAALALAQGNPAIEAKIYAYQADQLHRQKEDDKPVLQKRRKALERAIAEAKSQNKETKDLEGELLDTLKYLEEWDVALTMAAQDQKSDIYVRMGNISKALEIYEEKKDFGNGFILLYENDRYEEAFDWRLKALSARTAYKGQTREDFIQELKGSYSNDYRDFIDKLPSEKQSEARERLCESARRKAESMGIDVSQLVLDCNDQ